MDVKELTVVLQGHAKDFIYVKIKGNCLFEGHFYSKLFNNLN